LTNIGNDLDQKYFVALFASLSAMCDVEMNRTVMHGLMEPYNTNSPSSLIKCRPSYMLPEASLIKLRETNKTNKIK
jgi:hypothetical protein